MKKASIILIVLVQAFLSVACNNSPDKSSILTNESDVDQDAKAFMKAASTGGVMEVELSKIAQEQASNPAVREFAAMMIKDHTKIYNELKKLATDKYILLPLELDQEQKDEMEELRKLSGPGFDERYMRLMVTNHEKALAEYQIGARNRDPQVNKMASSKLDSLKIHLNSAKSIFYKLIINRN